MRLLVFDLGAVFDWWPDERDYPLAHRLVHSDGPKAPPPASEGAGLHTCFSDDPDAALGLLDAAISRCREGHSASETDLVAHQAELHVRYGLKRDDFESHFSRARYAEGVEDVFADLDRSCFVPVLVSSGFGKLTRRAQLDLQVRYAVSACEYLFDDDGVLRGFDLFPASANGRLGYIHLLIAELQLPSEDWVFVARAYDSCGLAKMAPMTVGFNPDFQLQKHCDVVISNLGELLPLLADDRWRQG